MLYGDSQPFAIWLLTSVLSFTLLYRMSMDFTDFADFLALRFPSKGGKEFTTEQINKINLIPISNL